MRLEVLIGMVCSGKSLYARRRADDGALTIGHDWLTQGLHGGAYRYEQGLRSCYRAMEESLVSLAMDHGRDAIIDRCHLTKESRRRWLRFAGNYDEWRPHNRRGPTTVVAVAFPIETPEVHARRRFESDPRGRSHEEWYMVAQHHFAQHLAEPLSEDEGFAEIIRPEVNLCEKDSGTS